MKNIFVIVCLLLLPEIIFSQSDFQRMFEAEKAFERSAADEGIKSAYVSFLAEDSIIFRPNATNGKEFWRKQVESTPARLDRNLIFADIASNGMLGYTTGNWRLLPKEQAELATQSGQYVTIWEKKSDGRFRVALDIGIANENIGASATLQAPPKNRSQDLNKRGWSAADASMLFLKLSMSGAALSGAYKNFAGDDIQLLLERHPPLTGKKRVVSVTKQYKAIQFPKKVAMFQSADMAYFWNPCEYVNSNEGSQKGNCLHIWKFRKKKWWIVLGIFSPIVNETQPVLKFKARK